jgi:5-methylcytosine-specific restriction endonuclease McrA
VKAEFKKLEGKQTEDAPPQRPEKVNSRLIKAALKRKIWKRDKARCQFISKDGHRCEERHGLQLEHIKPYARGGPATEENLRLLCGAHNRWRSRAQ